MPVSLARRIRRIGIMPSTYDEKGKRTQNFDSLDAIAKNQIELSLRVEARQRRQKAFAAMKEPLSSYRRSRNRRKVAQTDTGKKK
jgi:L-2-hydroxyglutarate oxidase LhgO